MRFRTREWKWSIVTLAVLNFAMPQAGKAEEPLQEAIKLEDVVVTATKTVKKVEDVPGR